MESENVIHETLEALLVNKILIVFQICRGSRIPETGRGSCVCAKLDTDYFEGVRTLTMLCGNVLTLGLSPEYVLDAPGTYDCSYISRLLQCMNPE